MPDAPPPARLVLQLAAAPQAGTADGRRLALAPRDAALLAWLAIEGPTPRNRLAALLWPGSADEAARNALRQRLFQLKKQLGAEAVSGQATLALADGVAHDLHESDDVLAGLDDALAGELADWLAHQRRRRAQRLRQSLAELAEMAERSRDWPDALTHAHELLALHPQSEEAHRRVMRLHYLAGDRAAALMAFDACERMLKNEIGTRPGTETLALLALVEAARAAPVPVSVLSAGLRRPPTVVGRDAELRALQASWQAGQPVLLLGEAGIGKTRLLEALAEGWPGALRVGARPADAGVPLALVARLVALLGDRRPECRAWPATAALQHQLAPGDEPGRPQARSLGPALRRWLDEWAAQPEPPALLIDDWQFADEASVELLLHELDPAALRWAIAARPPSGPDGGARVERLRRQRWRLLTLGPLGEEAIAELVARLLGPAQAADPPQRLAEALMLRIGGNPLYVLEALRHQAASGQPLQARHVAAPLEVRALVAERQAALPAPARQLLQLAAVAGSDFGVELAEAVTGHAALDLAEAWAQLERQGLFGAQGAPHDVHAELALAQLPRPIAGVLHGRVAAWLESQPHAASGDAARLAAHWHAAGDHARALPHWHAAARQAWQAARAPESFEFFAHAGEALLRGGQAERSFDLWFEAADAMTEIGTAELTERCLQAMQRLARSPTHALRVRFVALALRFVSGGREALAELESLMSEAIALDDTRVEAECRVAAAQRSAADGRFDDALQNLAAGERLLRGSGDLRRATSLAASKALLLGLRGQARLALEDQRRMLPLLAPHDRATWSVLSASHALQLVRMGDLDAATAAIAETRGALARASLAPRELWTAAGYLVDALRWLGDHLQALALLDEIEARLAPRGQYTELALTRASLWLALGRADLAHPLLTAPAALADVRKRERLRFVLLRTQSGLTTGRADLIWPDDALDGDDLPQSVEWALWSGLAPQAHAVGWTNPALEALLARCEAGEMRLLAAPLRALVAWRTGRPAPPAQAFGAALPWEALFAARAGGAADLDARVREARAWLQARAAALAPPWRESYLQRMPLHRALAALAV